MLPKISVVILNWNGLTDTIQCIESIKSSSYQNYTIIVVDNGSAKTDLQVLKSYVQHNKKIILKCNPVNAGFTGGNNIGIEMAMQQNPQYVLLLNNDTIVSSNFFNELVIVGEQDENIGILGPHIYYYSAKNVIWSAGIKGKRGPFFIPRAIGYNERDKGDYDFIREVWAIDGCALMIKANVIKEIGLLDDKFVCMHECIDYCIRAKMVGYKSIIVPAAKVWHKVSSSFSRRKDYTKEYYNCRNLLLMSRCYIGRWNLLPLIAYFMAWSAYELMRLKPNATKAYLRGMYDGLLGR